MKTCSKCGGELVTSGGQLRCRACDAKRKREWVAKNPDRRRETRAAWYAKNAEKQRGKAREWRAKNPELAKERNREATRKWKAEHPGLAQERNREWRANNPDRVRELTWKKNGVALTWDGYQRMQVMQDFRCANPGCRVRPGENELVPDHDHQFGDATFGNVRGLLCGPCNSAGGLLGDSPVRMRGLAAYHEKHHPRLMMPRDEGPLTTGPSRRDGS